MIIVRALTDEGYEVIAVAKARIGQLPTDIPTIYKPFSIATPTGAVRKLLSRK